MKLLIITIYHLAYLFSLYWLSKSIIQNSISNTAEIGIIWEHKIPVRYIILIKISYLIGIIDKNKKQLIVSQNKNLSKLSEEYRIIYKEKLFHPLNGFYIGILAIILSYIYSIIFS